VGDDVHACLLAEGAPGGLDGGRVDTLREYAKRSGEVMGFSSLRFDHLPGGRLDTMPQQEVAQRIEDLVDTIRPEILYTHFPWDVDPDHAVVGKATWAACRPYRFRFLRCIVAFETPSSTEWALPSQRHPFQPNRFVDVHSTFEQKLDAMRCYRTEIRDHPHPRSLRGLRDRASYWGSVAGYEAVEPFVVLRESW
jgi:LmbE family N-acetylglucosaminyl deacetylase